ncbi:MAG: uracil-DNA glycosylase [Proteobacteria bacterium]|uniref:Uracil-DNA glycosylase n=1 Tax=SAR86 cluster bacterium TaxID=2030880 RepID=A0A937IFH1_9GAMM|nr:uracil-DNA glycosylase [SAR86 cluster bacterium]MBL6820158.1 uracil-DNA glycosylase [SAR86 cluster bacterium]MDA0345440.1 uracil-DNA glycosylase [Pseudomonadota bacterium]MDA0899740.1 uracil-DNA glycosylase [Pseudomonadota bacterium]
MNWEELIELETKKDYFKSIKKSILSDNKHGKSIFPYPKNYFKAFELCSFKDLKVVILGQDPYHTPGVADGLAFSSGIDSYMPPSLRNIFLEIESDVGIRNKIVSLEGWAKQGVLLLNSYLSVQEGEPLSHAKIGWEIFTNKVLIEASRKCNVVFMLWGSYARSKKDILKGENLILETTHPSPLSAHRGFFGCKHFSRANAFLEKHGTKEIDWQLT